MSTDTRLDESLRSLDCATPLTAEEQQRAAATLERIVASDPGSPSSPASVRRFRHRPVLACVAAVAALAGAVVVLPGGIGGGQAYASWTPVPTPLTDAEIALIGPECTSELGKGGTLDLKQARLVLAERRGEYAALLYRTDNPDMAGSCLAHNAPGSDDVDDVKWGAGGGSGPAEKAPPRSYTQGAIADFKDASITDGAVGTDVTGVTIHARELTVHATVANGRYVAWWPGPAFDRDAKQSNGDAGPELFTTFDLTLRDGTVVHNAQPAIPR